MELAVTCKLDYAAFRCEGAVKNTKTPTRLQRLLHTENDLLSRSLLGFSKFSKEATA